MKTLRASFKRYFFTGLLVITPIWGTILVLRTLFVTVDSIVGDLLAEVVIQDYYVPGLGIVALMLLIFLTGILTTNFIGGQIVKRWEAFLDRVPIAGALQISCLLNSEKSITKW